MISTNNLLVIFSLLLAFEGSLCQLVFRDSPASSTVLVNYPTTLTCSAYEPTPPANILWLINGIISDSDSRGRVLIAYNPSTGVSEYVINTVSYLDVGEYQCFAVNATDGILASSAVGTLTVQGYPGFAQPLPVVIVPLGGSALFDCAVLSDPPATVSWTYEYGSTTYAITTGPRITISPPTTLMITNVQMSDEGFYVCGAVNSYGRNSTSGRLTIGTPPPRLNIMLSPSSPNPLLLNQGDTLSLSCSVASGSHLGSLQWTRGSTPVVEGVTQTSNTLLLSIPSVQFEHGGVYTCTAEDATGNTETIAISVVVNVPPQFTITPDDILTLERTPLNTNSSCTAVGDPVPTITWLRSDGTSLPVVNGDPQFGTLTRSDSGVFACVASNIAGEVRHEFTVTVQGPPIFTLPPTNTEASYGQGVVFQCVAVGPPDPSYTWTRLGEGLPPGAIVSSDATELHLFSVTVEDEGVYQCNATNVYGTITGQGSLTLLARPQILSVTTGPIFLEVGTTLSLSCTYTGPPSAVLLWYLNGVLLAPSEDPTLTISPDGTLSVTSPQERYSGEYVCNVSTSFAFDVARVTVTIGNPPKLTEPPSNVDLSPGSMALLPCLSTGLPQPWSTWFKTDNTGVRNELPTIGSTFTKLTTGLELHDVAREDSGVYECMVQNGIGSAAQAATIRVEGIPLVTGIRPLQLTAGESMALICTVGFNFPAGGVSWSRADGVDLPTDRFTVNRDGELVVTPVIVEDESEYLCTVTNVYGSSTIKAFIVVHVTPSINLTSNRVTGIVKNTLTMSCPATGQPPPSVQWTLPDGTDASTTTAFSVDPNSGTLTLFSPNPTHEGTFTCVASNVVGSVSAQIELLVRGPAVSTFAVQIQSTTRAIVMWSAPPPDAALLMYQLEVGRPGGVGDRITTTFTPSRDQTFLSNLSPGTTYEFIIRGLFEQGLLGADTTVLETTIETAPTGTPQNITVYPRLEALGVNWTQPLESERNGIIISYTIFYRETPANATSDPPFMNLTYPRGQEVQHSLVIENLGAVMSYDVKILASTAVGDGPESPVFRATTNRRFTFDPVDFTLVTTVVIAVGAGVLGCLLLVAVIMALCLVGILGWRRYKKMGKHKPLIEEQAFERQKNKKSRNISISSPIPGITPKFDNSVDGKFTVHGQNGRVINLRPKIITEKDVATPPREGQTVQVVPREKILVSKRVSDPYEIPADAINDGGYSVPRPQSGQSRNGRVVRPESGVYSEVQDVRKDGLSEAERIGQDHTDSYQPHNSDMWGRAAAEESETNLEAQDNVPEIVVVQTPSPERRGPEGEDTGSDSAQLVYATISNEHKQNKREKKQKDLEQEEAKLAKQQKKMQEKMEREQKKQEVKRRKQEDKELKKRSKDQQLRSSMGLDNVVHLHELDPSSGNARAQAEFIDAATAALF